MQSPPTILCDYCGQLFETRKALSCHARAHLRQLGLLWSIKTSPIDVLREVMMHGKDAAPTARPSGKATWTSSPVPKRPLDGLQSKEAASKPLDFSMKEKSPTSKSRATHMGRK